MQARTPTIRATHRSPSLALCLSLSALSIWGPPLAFAVFFGIGYLSRGGQDQDIDITSHAAGSLRAPHAPDADGLSWPRRAPREVVFTPPWACCCSPSSGPAPADDRSPQAWPEQRRRPAWWVHYPHSGASACRAHRNASPAALFGAPPQAARNGRRWSSGATDAAGTDGGAAVALHQGGNAMENGQARPGCGHCRAQKLPMPKLASYAWLQALPMQS